jgi:hypothetical protein
MTSQRPFQLPLHPRDQLKLQQHLVGMSRMEARHELAQMGGANTGVTSSTTPGTLAVRVLGVPGTDSINLVIDEHSDKVTKVAVQWDSAAQQPPPPQAQTTATSVYTAEPSGSFNPNQLGRFLDGWADLIENLGDQAPEVQSQTYQQLISRDLPDIKVKYTTGYASRVSAKGRHYITTTTSPGATTAIYIGQHGKDLYVSWKTWIKPTLNWQPPVIMVAIAGTISFCGNSLQVANNNLPIDRFIRDFALNFIALFIFEFIIMLVAGWWLKHKPLHFFITEPNVFDADDITAMSLAAHKSIQTALDQVGIDTSMLRRKRDFKGGRQDEIV